MGSPYKTVAFQTLGCKLNFAETSTLARDFSSHGYAQVGIDHPADLYVINTCSVTDNANKKARLCGLQSITVTLCPRCSIDFAWSITKGDKLGLYWPGTWLEIINIDFFINNYADPIMRGRKFFWGAITFILLKPSFDNIINLNSIRTLFIKLTFRVKWLYIIKIF